MYKIGNNVVVGAKIGSTNILKIYLGSTKIYPALVSYNSGTIVSDWSYTNGGETRSKTLTPWTQEVYQNYTVGSYVYGTVTTVSQDATVSYNYGTWVYSNGYSSRSTTSTPRYSWPDDDITYGGASTITQYGTLSYSAWIYNNDYRERTTYYSYDGGSTVKSAGTDAEYAAVDYNYWDGSTYGGGYCGTNYYYVDYKQVCTRYSWQKGDPDETYSAYSNGDSRSRRIDGSCGWVRNWTAWTNTGEFCNSSGTLGAYNCDGTYSVDYYRQVRYYQYPDGSGTTDTQYQVGSEHSRSQVDGQCGYTPVSRSEVGYYSYSPDSPADAWWNTSYPSSYSGYLYWDDVQMSYFNSPTGNDYAATGYYITYWNENGINQSMYLEII